MTGNFNEVLFPHHPSTQPHRVLIPEEEDARSCSRQSVAFFAQADNDVTIRCVDGSDKYPAIRAEDDLKERFLKSYGYADY